MITSRSVTAAGLAVLYAVLATPAQAVNLTTPATACRPTPVQDPASLQAIQASPFVIFNADPHVARTVLCPVVRHGDADGVTVVIRGNTAPDARLRCTVFSIGASGSFVAAVTRVAGVSGARNFTLTFPFTGLQAPADGHMNAMCRLPPIGRGQLQQFQTLD